METMTMTENYLDLTIEEVYDVITSINIWPQSFDHFKCNSNN